LSTKERKLKGNPPDYISFLPSYNLVLARIARDARAQKSAKPASMLIAASILFMLALIVLLALGRVPSSRAR